MSIHSLIGLKCLVNFLEKKKKKERKKKNKQKKKTTAFIYILFFGEMKFASMTHISRTVKILKIRTPKKFAVITLKFEQSGSTIE